MKTISSAQDYVEMASCSEVEGKTALREARLSEEVWIQIIKNHSELKRTVTLNRYLPENVLRILASDADAQVRTDVANRRALPQDLFAVLARDNDEGVRARIAWNRKSPKSVLDRLALDSADTVSEPARRRVRKAM